MTARKYVVFYSVSMLLALCTIVYTIGLVVCRPCMAGRVEREGYLAVRDVKEALGTPTPAATSTLSARQISAVVAYGLAKERAADLESQLLLVHVLIALLLSTLLIVSLRSRAIVQDKGSVLPPEEKK